MPYSQMEKEIKKIIKSEAILKKIIDNSCREFLWTTVPGNINERFYSENIINITGYNEEEINSLPDKYFSIIQSEDLPDVIKKVNLLDLCKTNSASFTYRIINKENKIIWLSEEIFLDKDKKTNLKYIFGRSVDITERMNFEEEMNKKEIELVHLNAAKDKFISIISHDLKSPFTSILGFVDILINEKNINEKDKQEYLRYIHNSSEHQLQLVNYLSEWCKIKNGRIKLERRKLCLNHILHNSISALTGEAVRKGIKVVTDIKGTFSINADEKLISDAVTHILDNAIKFSNENQCVEVSAGIFNNEFVEVVIKDEGIGISEVNQEKLFKIDSIFSTEGTKGEKGTGLGLALAKEIISKHNGEIWFYSEKGKGTEFHFTVPHLKDFVLIINDDPLQRTFIEDVIENEFSFYDSVTTETVFDALNIIEEKIPTLIITLNDAPLVNDVNLIEIIRKISRTDNLPVVIVNRLLNGKNNYSEISNIFEIFPPLNKKDLIRQLKLALNL